MVSINFEGAKQFYARQPDAAAAQAAFDTLVNGTGAGNDFIGWVDLPVNYDKDEFARIQKAAAKIQADSKALVVIGIGGSYLGARAVVELLKSPNYNALPKSTPDIYFAGNGISSDPVVLCLAVKDPRDPERFSTEGDDRDRFMGLNSPQTFTWAFLRDLYEEGRQAGIMDKIDPHTTSLMAALGKPLYFSKGSSMNIKITSRDDVKLFNAYLLSRDQEFDF